MKYLLDSAPLQPTPVDERERLLDLMPWSMRTLRTSTGQLVGLIGDIDTLIAATSLEHELTVITTDADYTRVPGLSVQLLTMAQLRDP